LDFVLDWSHGNCSWSYNLQRKSHECIGEDLIHFDYLKGFRSQFATAICICLGSHLGIPLSTTYCIVGALAGVFIAGKFSLMKKIFYR
jgi:PiT family inorganic phosphate transporter